MIVATINVRGCALDSKRRCVDSELASQNVEICGIQEARCCWERLQSTNYDWYLSSTSGKTSHRGVGIMVKKNTGVRINSFRAISENVCSAWIFKGELKFIFVVVHIPSDKRMSETFAELANLLSKIPPEDDYMLVGDFNGHLGSEDVNEDFSQYVGERLQHSLSNENGFFTLQLITQFELKVWTTFAKSKSVLETWRNSKSSSQIDHILMPSSSHMNIREKSIYGIWPSHFNSDHKVLIATVRKQNVLQERPRTMSQRRENWNAKLLTIPKNKEKFIHAVRDKLNKSDDSPIQPASRWTELKNVIKDAACEAIPPLKKEPMSPKTKHAFDKLKRKLYRQNRFKDVEWCKKEVAWARNNLESVQREHTWKKRRLFFACEENMGVLETV